MKAQPAEPSRWLALYDYYPRLVGLARARGAGADAEDVASTVLLRVWENADVDPDRRWPYLARSVVNEIADRHRRTVRERSYLARTWTRPEAPTVEDEVVDKVDTDRLLSVLATRHPSSTMRMIRLRISGRTWSEVGAAVGRPAATVQARVRRALLGARTDQWSGA